jgi:predicted DNA-binding transcriptional regulator AlpA
MVKPPTSKKSLLSSSASPERRLHLDKRAGDIAASSNGDADDILSTKQVAVWWGVSEQWLIDGRNKKYGPPYFRLSPGLIRYRRSELLEWLKERQHKSCAEYSPKKKSAA